MSRGPARAHGRHHPHRPHLPPDRAPRPVFFSFSTADEDYHAPNEFFRLQRLKDGTRAWARYWQELGRLDADRVREVASRQLRPPSGGGSADSRRRGRGASMAA